MQRVIRADLVRQACMRTGVRQANRYLDIGKLASRHADRKKSNRHRQAGRWLTGRQANFIAMFFSSGRKVSPGERASDALYTSAGDPGPQKYQERGPQELSY
jgi:hypothetical protein